MWVIDIETKVAGHLPFVSEQTLAPITWSEFGESIYITDFNYQKVFRLGIDGSAPSLIAELPFGSTPGNSFGIFALDITPSGDTLVRADYTSLSDIWLVAGSEAR